MLVARGHLFVAGAGVGVRCVVGRVVSLIFAGWLPQFPVSVGAVERGLSSSVTLSGCSQSNRWYAPHAAAVLPGRPGNEFMGNARWSDIGFSDSG